MYTHSALTYVGSFCQKTIFEILKEQLADGVYVSLVKMLIVIYNFQHLKQDKGRHNMQMHKISRFRNRNRTINHSEPWDEIVLKCY